MRTRLWIPAFAGMTIVVLAAVVFANPAAAQPTRLERQTVDASTPTKQAVSIYRDPNRRDEQTLNRNRPQGFAMISETRQVTLPPGRSTVRFTGVAEGMVAVSAIVTGLPGGTIEKNRDADLLSPAALVDGTLGNRVTITRTNPGTGEQVSETAVVRTRANGGLVLESSDGFEAVRCAGLPETLHFDRIRDGLSPEPVFSVDTASDTGGTYEVTLTYLAWGFDWEANYVATIHEGGDDDLRFAMRSWLTLLNDNGQSFENAQLVVIAGTLNVVSEFRRLASPPRARPLRLTCWPIGSTAKGSPVPNYNIPPPPPPPPPALMAAPVSRQEIIVTGVRSSLQDAEVRKVSEAAISAEEEDLGDLKLYRVPEPVTVSAKGLKQVSFLDKEKVEGKLVYTANCSPWEQGNGWTSASLLIEAENKERDGLGVALPSGNVAIFERGPLGELLVAEDGIRDYPQGQEVELELEDSTQVFASCEVEKDKDGEWDNDRPRMQAHFTNANPHDVTVRLYLGYPSQWKISKLRTKRKKGQHIAEITVPANGERTVKWQARAVNED